MPDIKEKLVELLWEYDQMRMMRMSIEECVDRLIPKGVTVQEWISVKDRLPEDGEIVLVCGSRGGVYTAVHNKPGQYRDWHKLNSKTHYCDPTHWTPLPEPPKGEIE